MVTNVLMTSSSSNVFCRAGLNRMWFETPAPNYRIKGFHKSSYQEPEPTGDAPQEEKNHRHVRKFTGVGVERGSQAKGFAYGSEAEHHSSRKSYMRPRDTLYDRTSTEKVWLKRQQQEAEADIEAHQDFRARQKQELVTEKRKDLEMLQNYKPWGRPAAGAPRVTPSGSLNTRRQRVDFEEDDSNERPGYNPFGRPGAGAPLKTTSGKLSTVLKADPDLRFQDQLKTEVDHSLRYKPGIESREKRPTRERNRSESEEFRLTNEREKKLVYGRKLEEQSIRDRERRAREKAEEKAPPQSYPWGSNNIERDESGKVKGRKWVLDKDAACDLDESAKKYYAGVTLGMGGQGAGAPLRDTDGKIRTRVSNTKVTTGTHDEYDPWGRPGAGAPLKSDSGRVRADIIGKYSSDVERKSGHKRSKVNKSEAGRGEGIDTASWMRTGAIGGMPKRDSATGEIIGITKSFTDVTTNHYDIRPRYRKRSTDQDKSYFTDLQLQAEERHKQLQREKEVSKDLELQHVRKMENTWDNHNTSRPPLPRRQQIDDDGGGTEKLMKKREYCNQLRKMIDERSTEKRKMKESSIHSDKQHVVAFDQQWGRPGAGAPRLNHNGEVDTVPKNMTSMLETHVHTGWNFRRT